MGIPRPPALAAAVTLALTLALTPTVTAHAQSSLPRAPGAHIVTISEPAERGNEPGIAVDPLHPGHIVAVYQGPPHAAWSTDSGRTFTRATVPVPPDFRVAGDVSTTFDDHGHAFLCFITFDTLGTPYYWAHGAGPNGIFIRRSLDGGKTWEPNDIPVIVHHVGSEPITHSEDMPRIVADNAPHSPHRGSLYVGWISWQLDRSVMLFSRSTDDGLTWSAPIRISTTPGLPRDDNGGLVGFVGVVGADGTIYATWNGESTIEFTSSHDGGRTFAPSHTIVHVGAAYFGNLPGVARVMGFPQIAVDPHGALYVAWSDYRNGDVDVFLERSADHGRTWSKPVRVNTDPIHDGADQFFQWMTVDPVTGDVYVQFYDRRDDPSDRRTAFTLTRSTDGGRTFTNYAWTDTTFQSARAFLGDYTWLTAFDHRVYGAWTEPARDSTPPASARRGELTIVDVGTADFSHTP